MRDINSISRGNAEALKSVMCDVIKIRLKRRSSSRSGKGINRILLESDVKVLYFLLL